MKLSNQNKLIFIFSSISLVILTFLFRKLLFGNYSFIGPDSLSPQAIKQGIELVTEKTGEYPLWLPWVFSGLPSIHSFQNISDFYLPHYLYIFFNKMFGIPFIWNYIFHFIFGGIGCVLLLKRLKVDDLSAIFGALAFILTPYLITMVVHGHGSQMMTSVYIPWVVWAIHRLKSNPEIKNVGILALIVGFQLQRAHVQIAYYTWMLAGLYVLLIFIDKIPLLYISNKKKKLITFLMILSGLALGLFISLNIYIPALEYSSYSIRGSSGGGTGFEYATQWSFSLIELGTFILPSCLGFGGLTYWGSMPFTDYPNYMGILILIFAIIGGIKSENKEKNLYILAICFAFLLSLGKNFSLFYGFFYDYFPFFNKFRVPVMILILVQFCVSILAGLGLSYLKNNFRFIRINTIINRSIFSLISISIILFLFGKKIIYSILPDQDLIQRYGVQAQELINKLRYENIYQEFQFFVIILLFLLLLLYFYKKKKYKWSMLAYGIIFLSIIDLSIVNKKIIEPTKDSYRSSTLNPSIIKKRYLKEDEIIKFLKNDTSFYRIFPIGQLANQNRWSAFNIESIYGYHPAKLDNYNTFMNKVGFENTNILQMLNVKYLISLQDIEHPLFKKVYNGKLYHNTKYQNANIYLFTDFIDRAYFINKLIYLDNNNDALEYIKNTNQTLINQSIINVKLTENSFDQNRDMKINKISPNLIEIETNSKTNQFLVLSEIFYPNGWKAYINNNEIEIYQINSILRGVPIPAGSNSINFIFNPNDVKIGSVISFFSFLLSLLLVIIGCFINRDE